MGLSGHRNDLDRDLEGRPDHQGYPALPGPPGCSGDPLHATQRSEHTPLSTQRPLPLAKQLPQPPAVPRALPALPPPTALLPLNTNEPRPPARAVVAAVAHAHAPPPHFLHSPARPDSLIAPSYPSTLVRSAAVRRNSRSNSIESSTSRRRPSLGRPACPPCPTCCSPFPQSDTLSADPTSPSSSLVSSQLPSVPTVSQGSCSSFTQPSSAMADYGFEPILEGQATSHLSRPDLDPDILSLTKAAAVAVRRRTNSAPKPPPKDLPSPVMFEPHRRAASEGGEELAFIKSIYNHRLRSYSRGSSSMVPIIPMTVPGGADRAVTRTTTPANAPPPATRSHTSYNINNQATVPGLAQASPGTPPPPPPRLPPNAPVPPIRRVSSHGRGLRSRSPPPPLPTCTSPTCPPQYAHRRQESQPQFQSLSHIYPRLPPVASAKVLRSVSASSRAQTRARPRKRASSAGTDQSGLPDKAAREMYLETILAIREASMWEWPMPPSPNSRLEHQSPRGGSNSLELLGHTLDDHVESFRFQDAEVEPEGGFHCDSSPQPSSEHLGPLTPNDDDDRDPFFERQQAAIESGILPPALAAELLAQHASKGSRSPTRTPPPRPPRPRFGMPF